MSVSDHDAAAQRWRVWLALATIYLVWGSTYLAIRVMVETVPPLLGAGVRFVVAGGVFWLALRVRRGAGGVRAGRRELAGATVVGVLLLFGGNGLVTVAEQEVSSSLAALLIASVPLWVVVYRLLARERVPRATLAGVVVGFAGVALLVLPSGRPAGATLGGVSLVVAAAACWALGSFWSRMVRLPGDAMLSTALQMLIGGAAMLVVALATGEAGDVDLGAVSTRSALAFVYLIVAGSLAAFTAYVWLLQAAPISLVATYAYVNPVVAVVLGWAILSESITTTMIAGTAVVVASVAIVVRTGEAAGPQAPPVPEAPATATARV